MTRRVYWCSRCEYIGDKPDHVDHAEARWCTGVPVERWLVDPSEAREGWMVKVTARRVFNEKFPAATVEFDEPASRYADEYTAVLVVPVPDPPTNQESA